MDAMRALASSNACTADGTASAAMNPLGAFVNAAMPAAASSKAGPHRGGVMAPRGAVAVPPHHQKASSGFRRGLMAGAGGQQMVPAPRGPMMHNPMAAEQWANEMAQVRGARPSPRPMMMEAAFRESFARPPHGGGGMMVPRGPMMPSANRWAAEMNMRRNMGQAWGRPPPPMAMAPGAASVAAPPPSMQRQAEPVQQPALQQEVSSIFFSPGRNGRVKAYSVSFNINRLMTWQRRELLRQKCSELWNQTLE